MMPPGIDELLGDLQPEPNDGTGQEPLGLPEDARVGLRTRDRVIASSRRKPTSEDQVVDVTVQPRARTPPVPPRLLKGPLPDA